MNPSFLLSLLLLIHPFIQSLTNLSTQQSFHPSFHPSLHPLIRPLLPVSQPSSLSIHSSVYPSSNRSTFYLDTNKKGAGKKIYKGISVVQKMTYSKVQKSDGLTTLLLLY